MLKELCQYLVDLGAKPQAYQRQPDLETTANVVLLNRETGDLVVKDVPQQPMVATMLTVESLCRWVVATRADAGTSGLHLQPAIYISNDRVTAWLVEDTRWRHHATLLLRPSVAFTVLTSLTELVPKALVQELRFNLCMAEKTPLDLTARLSSLKFETNSELSTDHKFADDAVSKKYRAKVTGEQELPVDCTFRFAPWPDLAEELPELLVDVTCSIQPDATAGTVSIVPYPESIAAARRRALDGVAELVRSHLPETLAVSVYFGSR